MKFWPFDFKKPKIHKTKWKYEPKTITLDSEDTPKERAIKICQAMGLVINDNVHNMLPTMEKALEFYQKHDRLHRKKKPKNTYCPGCKRYLDEIKKDGCGSQRCPPLTAGPTPED